MFVKVNSNLDRARAAWGEDMPGWVRTLAAACDASNQKAVAERLGRSGGTISRILRRDYPGSYEEAELLVRQRFSADTVACPIDGEIPLASCVRARRRKITPRHAQALAWANTCPTCPNNSDRKED